MERIFNISSLVANILEYLPVADLVRFDSAVTNHGFRQVFLEACKNVAISEKVYVFQKAEMLLWSKLRDIPVISILIRIPNDSSYCNVQLQKILDEWQYTINESIDQNVVRNLRKSFPSLENVHFRGGFLRPENSNLDWSVFSHLTGIILESVYIEFYFDVPDDAMVFHMENTFSPQVNRIVIKNMSIYSWNGVKPLLDFTLHVSQHCEVVLENVCAKIRVEIVRFV